MKKLLLAALFAVVAAGASAQGKITVWWEGNISTLSTDGVDSEFKALNLGVAYTAPIQNCFEWSAGAGYVTKGCKEWDPGFIQLEGNGAWNFVANGDVKVGLYTGPYLSFLVAKDDLERAETVDFGWQGGIKASYKFLSFKLGYEYGFLDVHKDFDSKPSDFFFRIGVNF